MTRGVEGVVLSETESRALCFGECGLSLTDDDWSRDCICGADYEPLIEKGLAAKRERWPNGVVLNARGLALKAHLLAQDKSQ